MDAIALRNLSDKIEDNQANLEDYFQFEKHLKLGGLNENFIRGYLKKAGFRGWEDFYEARKKQRTSEVIGAVVVGGLVGMAAAVLIDSMQEN